MSDQWRITYMDGDEDLTPEGCELVLAPGGTVWLANGIRSGIGGREVKAQYPVVNIRKVERVR